MLALPVTSQQNARFEFMPPSRSLGGARIVDAKQMRSPTNIFELLVAVREERMALQC